MEVDVLDFCDANRIRVMGYSPYGMCWLALYAKEESGVDYGVTNLLEDDLVQSIARDKSATPAQVLLSWGLEQGVIQIPKTSKRHRVQESLAALDLELTHEELTSLHSLSVYPHRGAEASIKNHLAVIKVLQASGNIVLT